MRDKVTAATVLANEIARTEREDGNAFYTAKLMTVRWMQSNGSSDEEIERLLGICLHPGDRQKISVTAA